MSMAVNLRSAASFLYFDETKRKVQSRKPITSAEVGPYQVTVTVTAKVLGRESVQKFDVILVIEDHEHPVVAVEIEDVDFNDDASLTATIAQKLGIKDVEKVIQASHAVTDVTEDMDLEEAAKFDVEDWAKLSGLTKIKEKSIEDIQG